MRGINIFLFDSKENKPFTSEILYHSLAAFIDSALPKGPFALIDNSNQPRILGLRPAPQSDIAAFAPLCVYQGQAIPADRGFALFKALINPDIIDERKSTWEIAANRYKVKACITVVEGSTALAKKIWFVFVPNKVAMVYEWPDNGGTMLTIGPPFLDDDDATAAAAASAAEEEAAPTDAADQITVEIDPDEGDRAFYWIDDKAQICAAPFKFALSSGGSGLGQSRSDANTDSDNYWHGPASLGYALSFELSRHLDDKEFAKLLAPAASGAAAAAAGTNVRTGWFEAETSRKATTSKGVSYRGRGVADTKMDSEIRYIKNFDKKSPISKKNFPRSTIPYEATATESTFNRFSKIFKTLVNNSNELRVQKMKTLPVAAGQPFRPEGIDLQPNPNARLAAASVMGPAIRKIIQSMQWEAEVDAKKASVKLRKKSASATAVTKFALGAIYNDQVTKNTWKTASGQLLGYPQARKPLSTPALENLKTALRTQQEWCHLWGHGDGGSEIPRNFVAGSKHCNTEQLAIESGRRTRSDNMKGKITAYLLPQQPRGKKAVSAETIAEIRRFGGYLAICTPEQMPLAYKSALEVYTPVKKLIAKIGDFEKLDPTTKAKITTEITRLLKNLFSEQTAIKKADLDSDPLKALSNFLEWLTPLIMPQLPVAMFIRYKIFEGKKKIFDHIFDAQKESFDFNEYMALREVVERVVSKDRESYVNAVNRAIYWRLRDEFAADEIMFRLAFGSEVEFQSIFTDKLDDEETSPAIVEKFIGTVIARAQKASALRAAAKAKAGPGTMVDDDPAGDALAQIAKVISYK